MIHSMVIAHAPAKSQNRVLRFAGLFITRCSTNKEGPRHSLGPSLLVEMRGIVTKASPLRLGTALLFYLYAFLFKYMSKAEIYPCNFINNKRSHRVAPFVIGGDEGNRTPVRKLIRMTFFVGSLFFEFPLKGREQTRFLCR